MIHQPDFFIVGAPKSGTTSLFRYLDDHPQIFLPTVKEPHYYAHDIPNLRFVKSHPEYLKLFNTSNKNYRRFGEASAMYMYSNTAIPLIMKDQPQAKIIIMYRDPVDLIYSFHSQCLYGMEEDQSDFHIAWQLQDERKQGRSLPKNCNNPELLFYRDIASLGNQLSRLSAVVPQNQLMLIDFSDFVSDTAKIYRKVLSFLEVDEFNKEKFEIYNPNLVIKRTSLSKLVIKPPWPLSTVKRFIKKHWGLNDGPVTNFIRSLISKKINRPPLPENTKNLISKELMDDTHLFHNLLTVYNNNPLKKSA